MAEEIINEEIVPIEIVTSSEPKSKPKNYVKKIHENLVDAFGVNEVPDEVTFAKKIKDPKYVKLIHENLVDAFGVKEVPDFDKFSINFSTDLEKKNLGEANLLKSGNTLVPTELQLSSTENNLQSIVNKRPDPFDKNASPSDLARQSFNLKQPKSVTKKVVGVDMMGMPVESNEDIYDENSINTAKEIDKHLEKLGYTKDFASTISRIPEKYKEAVGYTDQELADLYKSDKNEFNKRTSNVIWRENLRDSMMEMVDNIDKSDLTPEEKDIQINKINTQAELLNQGAEQYAGDLKNKQYYVGESAKNIKQFITNPEKQKQALEDLALSTADDFGSIEDLEDKSKTALSKNINDYQSVALNYLDQIDPEKAAFYRKYIDIDTKDLQKFQYKGYDQLQKELDEIGLNLVVNNAKNKLKTLSDIAKQQGGQLDPQDYEEYNKLLETANTADARLSKLGLVYPNTVNVDTRSIAQELMGGGSSTLGLAGKNLAYGLAKTGKGFIDIVLSPFRSQQMNDNAALEALGIENYVESKTIPTKNQSALARDLPKITPQLDARILAIKNDKNLSQTEKEEQVDQLLQSNRDKWTPSSNETSWNLGPNAIFSSVANIGAKLAPFFAIEVLSQGAATPEILPATLASFGRMFSNVLVTSYSEELARAMNEKSANPELDAYGSVLVNSLAYKAAGVGDVVKNIRGAANEVGGITAKIIGKLEDKAIVNALKNPNSTLKGFLNNASQVIKEKGLEGVKTAAIFEGVLGAKDVMGGAKVDEEFIKQKALNLLTFSLFNTALGSAIGLSKVGKENKEALFLAATNKDEVLYEAKKALENKQISQSAFNEITQNVEAASKVLEKVPMVDGKGNQLGRKEATELMYLKIKEQYLEDQIKKDTPIKVQEKITKDLAEVQDQIDKVYKGTFIEGIGKPFEGIEARTKKEPKISTEEPIVENKQEVKPSEVKITEDIKLAEPIEITEDVKPIEEVSPIKIVEKVDIGTPKIEEPIIESEKPTKTTQEVSISKKALGSNYNFSKEFDVRGGDVVATDVLTEVTKKAEKNGIDVPTQRAIEVNLMSKGTPEPTEYNIVTAGSHLLNIDAKITKAQESGNLAEIESLNEQRNEVLSVLRTLGNKAGRNLGLFNLVFQETDRSEIKLTRDYLKKVLKVEVPETIAELEKSNLTAEQKKTVRPYVEKIEKAKASFDAIEKEVNKNIIKINDQEVNAAIEKARAEGKKEGFKEGMKANTSEEKQKKSKQIKDLASQIRRSDELDKFLKGAGPLGNAEKASFIDLGTYKEIVANVLDAVAAAVELGEDVSKAIKKAVDKFKDVDAARLISDVETIMSKAKLPNKQDVMEKILKISKAESATDITKKISDKGLVKDIVNSYLGDNLTNDQVLDAATKELKKVLPNVTREQVADAYAERGQFKKETKAKIENEINQKKADVKRLAVKEAKLKALEAADDYHLEETKEGKKRITSEYEKELDEKIKNLLKEKNNVEKQQKVSKTPKTEQDKIDEINREIKFVKETKSVYNQAIKDPKKASDALIAAREERDRTYAALGLKLEKNAKAPILIERNYQEALKEIENSYLPEEEKNNKIAELKAQRDLDLQGTKQGVVSSLSDDINNYIESNIENSDLNNSLKDVLKDLTPSGEKLDDQINKAYNKLNKLVKDERLTKEEKQNVKEIITDLENNNQLTSDELASKRLKKQWENEIRTAETDIASGNFTKLPSNTFDYRRNDELFRLNKARENKSGQLNRMIADAKEKNRTTAEKAIDLSTKFLVSGIHTAAKVAEAATFKPFMDSMVDLTAGRVASYITGAPYTSLYSVKKGYKTFTAFKNKEAAEKYIQSLQDKRDVALENLKEAHENNGDIKKADKEFKKADLEYAVSTLYNSIESNVLNSFWQYMKHGATDYDVSIGKSSKKDISEYRTVLGKTGYVLDGWIRMHSAMKSSLSARPEMMKVFSSTLKDFQRRGMELNAENISTAMVLAADAYEAGRLTNKTALSKIISRGKGSEKSTAMRLITKGIVPVSTIAVNLAKRGIDYSTLGAEGFVRLANETKKGMKLNEVEGKTYDGLVSAVKDGWNRIPLKERAYINGVIGRGLFGSAIMLATAYGLQNGMIKYGGTFEDQRKRKIMGSDDEQLKAGEWEFFGKRLPKAASLFLNHLPEFLAVSLIADNYQINQMGGTGGEKFETTIDEVEARLPFQTMAGIFVPGRRVNTLVDRFTRIPIAAEAATLFDEKAEFRDKSDFINRIRGNVGFGIANPTKEQQKQINEIMKQIRKLPSGTLTLEDEKDIDAIIEEIKNTDFGELEMKKMMEESKKE
jgi:hypothetical protein